MKQKTRKKYGGIKLLNIECNELYDWEERDATHIRISLPTTYKNASEMGERGFFWQTGRLIPRSTWRVICVCINYDKLVRVQTSIINGRNDDILVIAMQSRKAFLQTAGDSIYC